MLGPRLVSISPQRRFLKCKGSVYVTKDKMKKISCISCENHGGFITNIFKWDNNCSNNKRCNIIT